MSYSIGINVVVTNCLDDLNLLRRNILPNKADVPWKYWVSIMRSGGKVITCFDDITHQIIGMTLLIPSNKPKGIRICETSILSDCPDFVEPALMNAAHKEIKKSGLDFIPNSIQSTIHEDAITVKKECCLRILSQDITSSTELSDAEDLVTLTEFYFEKLIKSMPITSTELDILVQTIEGILRGQTDFIYRFRQCVYGLNDLNNVDTR